MAYTGQLTGTVCGKEPEVRYFESGKIVCNFSISARQSKKDAPKRYIKVAIWGKSAEYVGNYVRRGDSVLVTGRIEAPETYQAQDGTTKVSEKFTADNIEKFIERQDGQQQQQPQPPAAAAPPAAAPPADACGLKPPAQTIGEQNVAAWNSAPLVPDTDDIPF